MSRQRLPYATCCAAARAAIAAAIEWRGNPWDGEPDAKPKSLGVEHWKVLAAVIARTVLYSKLEDYLYTDALAADTQMHVKNVQQRLRELHRARIITYQSRGGRGHPSYVALPEKGEPTQAALLDVERGADFSGKGSLPHGESTLKGEPLQASLPRRNPEKISEARTRAGGACDCEHDTDRHGHAESCPAWAEVQR